MCYVYDNIAYTDVDHEVFMTGNMLHGFLHVWSIVFVAFAKETFMKLGIFKRDT